MRNRTLTTAAAVAALALTLTACGGSSATAGAEQSGTNAPAASSKAAEKPSSESTPAEEPEDDANKTLKFGQTATFEDGLSVTISKPKKYTPSEYSGVEGAKAHLMFTVKVVNKTGKPFDPALFYVTVQSSNNEAEQAFDSAKGLKGSPNTKILNGREATFKIGFGVADPKDLVMEVNPGGFDYNPVIFTS